MHSDWSQSKLTTLPSSVDTVRCTTITHPPRSDNVMKRGRESDFALLSTSNLWENVHAACQPCATPCCEARTQDGDVEKVIALAQERSKLGLTGNEPSFDGLFCYERNEIASRFKRIFTMYPSRWIGGNSHKFFQERVKYRNELTQIEFAEVFYDVNEEVEIEQIFHKAVDREISEEEPVSSKEIFDVIARCELRKWISSWKEAFIQSDISRLMKVNLELVKIFELIGVEYLPGIINLAISAWEEADENARQNLRQQFTLAEDFTPSNETISVDLDDPFFGRIEDRPFICQLGEIVVEIFAPQRQVGMKDDNLIQQDVCVELGKRTLMVVAQLSEEYIESLKEEVDPKCVAESIKETIVKGENVDAKPLVQMLGKLNLPLKRTVQCCRDGINAFWDSSVAVEEVFDGHANKYEERMSESPFLNKHREPQESWNPLMTSDIFHCVLSYCTTSDICETLSHAFPEMLEADHHRVWFEREMRERGWRDLNNLPMACQRMNRRGKRNRKSECQKSGADLTLYEKLELVRSLAWYDRVVSPKFYTLLDLFILDCLGFDGPAKEYLRQKKWSGDAAKCLEICQCLDRFASAGWGAPEWIREMGFTQINEIQLSIPRVMAVTNCGSTLKLLLEWFEELDEQKLLQELQPKEHRLLANLRAELENARVWAKNHEVSRELARVLRDEYHFYFYDPAD